jgi:Mn2+/Fe2+ NRAMP family transporter
MAFNALVLPIVLGFLIVMANDKKILGDRRNSRLGNFVSVGLSVVCVALGLWYGALTLMGKGS